MPEMIQISYDYTYSDLQVIQTYWTPDSLIQIPLLKVVKQRPILAEIDPKMSNNSMAQNNTNTNIHNLNLYRYQLQVLSSDLVLAERKLTN